MPVKPKSTNPQSAYDPNFIEQFAQAIATMEGFYRDETLARLNNNPGNLRPWKASQKRDKRGYRVFATLDEGWEALRAQIRLNIGLGLTTYEFFGGKPNVYPGYAPAADSNHPRHYAQFVAERLAIKPSAVLLDVATL